MTLPEKLEALARMARADGPLALHNLRTGLESILKDVDDEIFRRADHGIVDRLIALKPTNEAGL